MSQKDKVKELVGGGLNAYHTKALQQMDRIEKKNKQQNHKISMLTNELDNDYLTKTEEGSVISLDHSKEGMVYIDSLEGNTLVNYCTDGSKEMTLNGDIDVEGTFVTTTEGIENGLVDVYCEGNTLIVDADGNEVDAGTEGATLMSVGQDDENGHKIEILSSNGKPNLFRNSGFLNGLSSFSFHNQSRGTIIEDATSGSGKILKVVAGENLNSGFYQANLVPHIENTKYTLSCYCKGDINSILDLHIERHKHTRVQFTNNDWVRVELTSELNPTNWNRTITFYSQTPNATFYVKDIKIEVSDYATPYIPHTTETNYNTFKRLNKKEILLNEPLRGLPNGVKDRFVKLGGKWYIERNCVGYTPDTSTATFRKNYNVTSIIDFKIDNIKNHNQSAQSFYMECLSTIPYGDPSGTNWQNETHWLKYYPMTKNTISTENQRDKGGVSIFYNKEWTDQQIIDWCNNNNLKFILPCEIPTYEEITDVELMTYLDTTHISNNSIIPCNMKIKNSGYNAIIKPSTLYTVALDTNKSGTIGINLGGVKGITTNNVLTLTTPATLTDDSLRLYGKGIKGSKVRLLEGDKTNWISSFFEGMKSSFEDKVQDDGSYKMEILMSNRNLFSTKDISYKGAGTNGRIDILTDELIQFTNTEKTYTQAFMVLRLKPFTTYKLSAELQLMQIHVFYGRVSGWDANKYFADINNLNSSNLILKTKEFTTDKSGIITLRTTNEQKIGTNIAKNIIVEEIDGGNYVPHKQNKIQFSSIEPLRKLDKFVFKDNMLMVERNNAEKVLNGTENWSYDTSNSTQEVGRFGLHNEGMKGNRSLVICDKYAFKTNYTMTSHNYEGTFTSIGGNTLYLDTMLNKLETKDLNGFKKWLSKNPVKVVYELVEPVYEEIPFELQKIILEGYENGTLFFDTNIPPTSTVTYAGETPIVKATKLNKTEVLNNTNDINDNIIPYLMDMDYRVVCLQLATEEIEGGVSMARLLGGAYEMLKRDILSKRLTKEEYGYRLADYFNAGKLTEQEVRELEDLR